MLVKSLISFRERLAINYSLKRIKNKDFTIISDNCWGANLYVQLKITYKTPTIGLGMGKHDFLNFIENLHADNIVTHIQQVDSSHCHPFNPKRIYPVGKTQAGLIHFLHYKNFDSAVRLFKIRYKKINWDNIFYKIDFEHKWYTEEHILRWNAMKLPNSIAFYSKRVKEMGLPEIHNGVYIDKWVDKTSYIVGNFQHSFNYIEWLNSGRITTSLHYRILNFLLLNPTIPRKLVVAVKSNTLKLTNLKKVLKRQAVNKTEMPV